jgi:hypothetical protein
MYNIFLQPLIKGFAKTSGALLSAYIGFQFFKMTNDYDLLCNTQCISKNIDESITSHINSEKDYKLLFKKL